ncbi:hypothetical protein CL621_01770 [archaeon]|nr:hypothetical protein [archaeon]|tara:strand:- start:502 stop:1992 length:1491 start_codon:yes stop_codon:yes gene_type:complete
MKNQKSIKLENVKLIAIPLLCMVVLVFPLILREINGEPLAEDISYYHTRIAQQISDKLWLPKEDNYLYGGRMMPLIPGLATFLAVPNLIFNIPINTFSKILPILIGVFSFLIFFMLLQEFKVDKRLTDISLFLLVISPPFIYTFTTLNDHIIPVFLILLSSLLYLRNKKFFSLMTFLLIPLFSIPDAFIGLFFFFIYLLSTKKKLKPFFFMLLLVSIISLVQYLPMILSYGLPELLDFKVSEKGVNFAFQNFISDFGGKFGVSLFSILLGISGLFVVWKKKYKNLLIYTLFIVLIVLSFYLTWLIVYLNFLLIVLASVGLIYLMKKKWESRLIKNFIILIFVFGLIFSGISHINRISKMPPSKLVFDSLNNLRLEPEGVVLSHYSNGFWISGIANKPVVMDRHFIYMPNVNQRNRDLQDIFYSINVEDITKLLDKYNINYIWIDKEMKEGQVWSREDDGLLFLLNYNPKILGIRYRKFEKIYSNEETEIWRVKENF